MLVVDEIGKNVSGAGMDTNVIGRGVDGRPSPPPAARARTIYARGLTPESHGNAIGIGLADVVSTRLVAAMDRHITYTNALSALTPATVRIPLQFDTDAECLAAAARLAGVEPVRGAGRAHPHTLALDRFVASEACARGAGRALRPDPARPAAAVAAHARGRLRRRGRPAGGVGRPVSAGARASGAGRRPRRRSRSIRTVSTRATSDRAAALGGRGAAGASAPGMVLAASIVGSGELIATTTLGAQVGYTALWLVLAELLHQAGGAGRAGPLHDRDRARPASRRSTACRARAWRVSWLVWAWALMVLMTHAAGGRRCTAACRR